MQQRNWILLAIAVAFGLFAVLIANAWFSGKEQQQEQTAQRQEMTRIVVASAPLEFGSRLSDQNVRLQDWPANAVPQGAFRSLPDALKNDRVALRAMVQGEPVLASNVSGIDGRATLAALLPAGMRAVSVPVNDVRGVSGFVLPGTLVDVLLTRKIPGEGSTNEDMRSDVILENVQVLAIDQVADDKQADPKVARTATLAVSLFDAQRLAVAEKIGTLSLALRRIEDSAGAAPVASAQRLVTNRDLGATRLVIPGRGPAAGPAVASVVAPALPAIGGGGAAAPARSGPSMMIVRGTEVTSYPVSSGSRR